jgi:predicted glutamine amidotransferase
MCGIVGCVMKHSSGFYKQTEDTFFQLLYVDALRGEDSTGVIGVEKTGVFHIMKEANTSAWVGPQIQTSTIGKAMYKEGKAYIGHNRKMTVGKVSDETAHPFVVDKEFALVHNGTLYNHESLAKTEVDSEALAITFAKAFEEENFKEALEETIPKINGAYAVALYDQRHNAVRLLRNKERPLAIAETHNAWYFASEPGMLYWILSRNNYLKQDLESIKMVPVDTVVSFNLEGFQTTKKEELLTPKKYVTSQTSPIILETSTGTSSNKDSPFRGDDLTKNAFKRLRRKFIGTRMEFWVDDWVEANYPRTFSDGETITTIMVDCGELLIDHTVSATVDLNSFGMSEADLDESLWSGRVENLEWSTVAKHLNVYLTDCVPVKRPIKEPIIDDKYIQQKLDEEEKDKYAKENQPTVH